MPINRIAAISVTLFVASSSFVLAQDQATLVFRTHSETGCLEQPIEDCIKQVQATFEGISQEEVTRELARLDTVDVNGQRVAKVLRVSLTGRWPDSKAIAGALIEMDESRRVVMIDVNLPDNPQAANTEQEYDKTRLFDAFVLGLGSNCAGQSKLAIYKFFQNTVKPKIKADPREVHFYETSVTTQNFRHAMNIHFCKNLFSYMSSYGVDTQFSSAENPDGFSSIYSASFSVKPQH